MFQSPIEDSFFSDLLLRPSRSDRHTKRFNPLSRIRSSLTYLDWGRIQQEHDAFQSPIEDSFFSDALSSPREPINYVEAVFQSPIEDSFFSDAEAKVSKARVDFDNLFQSPIEDSFFSDAGYRRNEDMLQSFNPLSRIRSSLT